MGQETSLHLIDRFIMYDFLYAPKNKGLGFSYIGWAALHATKNIFAEGMLDFIEARRLEIERLSHPLSTAYSTWPPLWIEVPGSISSPVGSVAGLLFFSPKSTYTSWKRSNYRAPLSASIGSGWNDEQWALIGVDTKGIKVFEFAYTNASWLFTSSHQCPFHRCYVQTPSQHSKKKSKKRTKFMPCQKCRDALHYWSTWFFAVYMLLSNQNSLFQTQSSTIDLSIPKLHELSLKNGAKTIRILSYIPLSKQIQQSLNTQAASSVATVSQKTFIISQYLKQQREIISTDSLPQKQRQQAAQEEVAIERAHKYFWTQNALIMTETVRHTTDGTPLRLPAHSLYIELEHPCQLAQVSVIAFSFLQYEQSWVLSVIDPTGQIHWRAWFDQGGWQLPHGYTCPGHQCLIEEYDSKITYTLCEMCQEQLYQYTSWMSTALRMIAGDFQEEVELQEPEYLVETSTKKVYDHQSKQAKEIKVHRRFRIIRYLDACTIKQGKPSTKRGSWMEGRPLAENEYDINPDAIIYVRIHPREHNRTYHHPRFTYARGTTKHIEPQPRLQPMTIATFRQLPRVQRITRVVASKFT